MERYIDAEKTLTDAWNALYKEEDEREKKVIQGRNETEIDNWLVNERPILQEGFEICQKAIVNAPTANVVETVLCKDCKHHEYEEPGMVYCPNIVGGWVSNNFFCKDGKRGDDEESTKRTY